MGSIFSYFIRCVNFILMSDSPDAYYTLAAPCEGEFKDRGSKFLAYAKPVVSQASFDDFLQSIKSLHPKARHYCYAFRLLDDDISRSSDDGEPSGTAGKPIMNQLLSLNLTNSACIVVRYFGGTKLGTSGLIKAYKEASKTAFNNGQIIQKFKTETITLHFDYGLMGNLLDTLKFLNLDISDKRFGESPVINVRINKSEISSAITDIKARLLNRSTEDITEDTEVPGLRISV